MSEHSEDGERPDSFDTENMLPGEPNDINAKADNDMLAGIIPDPRLPEEPNGGSVDYSDERNRPTENG